MIRKTALLAGVASALLMTAPAFAQDTPQDTPPTTETPAAPQRLELQPGATVRGVDGELGKLEGARRNDAGQQELTVRGPDGQLRAVPLAGLKQEGADVVVGWTTAEYQAAPVIADEAAAPATPAVPADPSVPTAPVEPSEAATPPAPSEAAEPVEPTDPAAEPTETETESEPQ